MFKKKSQHRCSIQGVESPSACPPVWCGLGHRWKPGSKLFQYIYSGFLFSLGLSNYDPVQTTLFNENTLFLLSVEKGNKTGKNLQHLWWSFLDQSQPMSSIVCRAWLSKPSETYVILLYDKISAVTSVNQALTFKKLQVEGLHNSDQWLQYPFKHAKGHQGNSNRPTEFYSGTKTVVYMHNGGHLSKLTPSWIFKRLQNYEKGCQLPLNIQTDTKISQIGQLISLLGQNPILCMKNGGRLEMWAPYWILKWQHDSKIFQQPIKRAKRHQDHLIQPTEFKYVTETDFYMQNSSHPEKMSAIVKFQLTNWECLIRNINWTSPESFKLVP